MIAPALLLAFAVAAGGVAGFWLDRSRWPSRSPGLGLWVWSALTTSTVAAAVLAGVAAAVPSVRLTPALVDLLHTCWASVRAHYATPGGAATSTAGLALAGGIGVRLLFRVFAESVRATRARRRHRQALLLLGRADRRRGLVVLPASAPAVYCLPGRPELVVCTSAALERLQTDELQAVLAHERAHLRGRHHHLLTLAAALRSAFPFVPTFRLAEENLTVLVEMRADDAARAAQASWVLGTALVKLAEATTPRVALGAAGVGLVARVHRLDTAETPISARAAAVVAISGLAVLVTPVLIALGPAAVAVALDYCPPGFLG